MTFAYVLKACDRTGAAKKGVVSWTALITANSNYAYGEEALACLKRMQAEGLPPNAVTF